MLWDPNIDRETDKDSRKINVAWTCKKLPREKTFLKRNKTIRADTGKEGRSEMCVNVRKWYLFSFLSSLISSLLNFERPFFVPDYVQISCFNGGRKIEAF